jgi:hypothetical protein
MNYNFVCLNYYTEEEQWSNIAHKVNGDINLNAQHPSLFVYGKEIQSDYLTPAPSVGLGFCRRRSEASGM